MITFLSLSFEKESMKHYINQQIQASNDYKLFKELGWFFHRVSFRNHNIITIIQNTLDKFWIICDQALSVGLLQ